jgi:SAM-dependent methyltransferase
LGKRRDAKLDRCSKNTKALNAQKQHWNKIYAEEPEFFGDEPSIAAKKALENFMAEKKQRILELGAGQGRDTLFFAKNSLHVTALDYSKTGVEAINVEAKTLNLTNRVNAVCHDIRKPLPFSDETFDSCYCHMLYCMAICNSELETLFQEVRRVLKPNGLNIYTVRNTKDAHYKKGVQRGEDIYEVGGFTVNFFSKEKIEHLAKGYLVNSIEEFEEGELPRRLFLVKLKKTQTKKFPQ